MRAFLLGRGALRDVTLLELLAYAGLRPESEAITLPWAHVRDRSIIVHDTKRGRERSVVQVDQLRETLAAWRLRRGRPGDGELVVPTAIEGPWSEHDWRNWRAACLQAGRDRRRAAGRRAARVTCAARS
jgi:hypothetical protein